MNKIDQIKFNELYQQHLNALVRQGKSQATIDAYSRAVRRISKFYGQCPDRLTEDQLKNYFTSLVKTHSWSTIKVDRNGLRFFYKYVLNSDLSWIDIVKPPKTLTLPDILTLKEIGRVINRTRELRYQTFILVAFSMGLRLQEALNLQVGDIDAERMKVHIRQGKGKKDRFVTLPERSLLAMRKYWRHHRHPKLIFPAGRIPEERHCAIRIMDRGGVQKSFKVIVRECGIHKSVTLHTLRHCYGAHLVEAGVNLRAIQQEMGHESPNTTALYTQLTQTAQTNTRHSINHIVNRLQIVFRGE